VGIKQNLDKNLNQRDKICVSTKLLNFESELEDAILFTCGHHFQRKNFFEKVMPQFKLEMDELALQCQIPISTKLITAEYCQLKHISLACPKCLQLFLFDTKQKRVSQN